MVSALALTFALASPTFSSDLDAWWKHQVTPGRGLADYYGDELRDPMHDEYGTPLTKTILAAARKRSTLEEALPIIASRLGLERSIAADATHAWLIDAYVNLNDTRDGMSLALLKTAKTLMRNAIARAPSSVELHRENIRMSGWWADRPPVPSGWKEEAIALLEKAPAAVTIALADPRHRDALVLAVAKKPNHAALLEPLARISPQAATRIALRERALSALPKESDACVKVTLQTALIEDWLALGQLSQALAIDLAGIDALGRRATIDGIDLECKASKVHDGVGIAEILVGKTPTRQPNPALSEALDNILLRALTGKDIDPFDLKLPLMRDGSLPEHQRRAIQRYFAKDAEWVARSHECPEFFFDSEASPDPIEDTLGLRARADAIRNAVAATKVKCRQPTHADVTSTDDESAKSIRTRLNASDRNRFTVREGVVRASPAADVGAPEWPAGFHTVVTSGTRERAIVVFTSKHLDPTGEVSAGAYWIAVGEHGRWHAPIYTGLRVQRPWVITAAEWRPDGGVDLQARFEQLDDRSITFPPVALRFEKKKAPYVLSAPLSALERDSDGDGLSDVIEERLFTDPAAADSDGDGKKDGEDPAPLIAQSGVTDRTGLWNAVIAETRGQIPMAVMGVAPVKVSVEATPRFSYYTGDRKQFADYRGDERVIVINAAELALAQKKLGWFSPFQIHEVIVDRTGRRAVAATSGPFYMRTFLIETAQTSSGWRTTDLRKIVF